MTFLVALMLGGLAVSPVVAEDSVPADLSTPAPVHFAVQIWVDESEPAGEEEHAGGAGMSAVYGHPCGMVSVRHVERLPPPGSADFVSGTEKVIEFDENGEIIRKWAMPVDSWVMAVNGEAILVSYHYFAGAPGEEDDPSRYKRAALRISETGELELAPPPVKPDATLMECPADVAEEFGVSVYDRCFRFHNLSSGEARFLAFEGVCT